MKKAKKSKNSATSFEEYVSVCVFTLLSIVMIIVDYYVRCKNKYKKLISLQHRVSAIKSHI